MALGNMHGSLALLLALYAFVFALGIAGAATIRRSNGFRLKMIPIYSKQSPIYPGNLTSAQRYSSILQLSKKRVSRLASMSLYSVNDDGSHPFVTPRMAQARDSMYIVEVAVGTPPTPFALQLDTGSELSWVQCVGCRGCYDLPYGSFDYLHSSTYKPVTCNDPLCVPRECDSQHLCTYSIEYGDLDTTEGKVIRDNILMYSQDSGTDAVVSNVLFGCALENKLTWGKNSGPGTLDRIGGMFALGRGPPSILSQLGEQGRDKFSYCLTDWKSAEAITYIRFGDYANYFPEGSEIKSTPLTTGPVSPLYYVNLIDISINGKELNIPDSFEIKSGSGGVYLDTGVGPTVMCETAYDIVTARLEEIFTGLNLQPYISSTVNSSDWTLPKFCYSRPQGFNSFPNITYHFEDADFSPSPDGNFLILDNFFCLQIVPERGCITAIGAFTMANHFFVHDIRESTLRFAKADCSSQ